MVNLYEQLKLIICLMVPAYVYLFHPLSKFGYDALIQKMHSVSTCKSLDALRYFLLIKFFSNEYKIS